MLKLASHAYPSSSSNPLNHQSSSNVFTQKHTSPKISTLYRYTTRSTSPYQSNTLNTSATSTEKLGWLVSTLSPGTHFLNATRKSRGGSPKITLQEGNKDRSSTEGERTAISCATCSALTKSTGLGFLEDPGSL
jgi:hypothetical protein